MNDHMIQPITYVHLYPDHAMYTYDQWQLNNSMNKKIRYDATLDINVYT